MIRHQSLARRVRLRALPLLALGLAACGSPQGSGGSGGAGARRGPVQFPVDVVKAEPRRVEYQLTAVGGLEAFEQVQVVARVEGAVERVLFQEGDTIAAGASLAAIEPERFRLAAAAARAALDRALAQEAEARAAVQRREAADATELGLYPQEEIDAWRTRLLSASAAVAQARVALAQAELDLDESRVRAPMGGVIQTRTVQTGQYVSEGDVLATLVQRDPLLLRFDVPEPDAIRLVRGMPVRFRVRGLDGEAAAEITHVGAQADQATRMVRVTAKVTDGEGDPLRPGAFAEVTIPIGASENAVVVPDTSIRPSERGFLAFVVEGELAHERVLELGLRTEDGKVEVKSGIAAGETVVVRGAEALRDGVTVKVSGAEPAAAQPGASGS